ncbi:MAG TPA: hypothetical protein VHK63_03525 [Candidatus Limnocylindria bacterium]|nr:hypothetical protein [Candidatus Limnocylindria bacterium]
MTRVDVALEKGDRRAFAIALEWPGWARSGKTEEEALERLAQYASRYAKVAKESALSEAVTFEVVERLDGGSGTDFGVPGSEAKADRRPLSAADAKRHDTLLQAAWGAFDQAARRARGRKLTTGPRGGGRDVDKMTIHVLEAEEAYLHQLGRRRPKMADASVDGRMKEVRRLALETLAVVRRGEEPPETNKVKKRWPPRYHVRRSAWHALDHAWEIEDRLG